MKDEQRAIVMKICSVTEQVMREIALAVRLQFPLSDRSDVSLWDPTRMDYWKPKWDIYLKELWYSELEDEFWFPMIQWALHQLSFFCYWTYNQGIKKLRTSSMPPEFRGREKAGLQGSIAIPAVVQQIIMENYTQVKLAIPSMMWRSASLKADIEELARLDSVTVAEEQKTGGQMTPFLAQTRNRRLQLWDSINHRLQRLRQLREQGGEQRLMTAVGKAQKQQDKERELFYQRAEASIRASVEERKLVQQQLIQCQEQKRISHEHRAERERQERQWIEELCEARRTGKKVELPPAMVEGLQGVAEAAEQSMHQILTHRFDVELKAERARFSTETEYEENRQWERLRHEELMRQMGASAEEENEDHDWEWDEETYPIGGDDPDWYEDYGSTGGVKRLRDQQKNTKRKPGEPTFPRDIYGEVVRYQNWRRPGTPGVMFRMRERNHAEIEGSTTVRPPRAERKGISDRHGKEPAWAEIVLGTELITFSLRTEMLDDSIAVLSERRAAIAQPMRKPTRRALEEAREGYAMAGASDTLRGIRSRGRGRSHARTANVEEPAPGITGLTYEQESRRWVRPAGGTQMRSVEEIQRDQQMRLERAQPSFPAPAVFQQRYQPRRPERPLLRVPQLQPRDVGRPQGTWGPFRSSTVPPPPIAQPAPRPRATGGRMLGVGRGQERMEEGQEEEDEDQGSGASQGGRGARDYGQDGAQRKFDLLGVDSPLCGFAVFPSPIWGEDGREGSPISGPGHVTEEAPYGLQQYGKPASCSMSFRASMEEEME
jgi:hypothetical protein